MNGNNIEIKKRTSGITQRVALFWILGALAISAVLCVWWIDPEAIFDSGVETSDGRYAVTICREERFEHLASDGDVDWDRGEKGRCATDAHGLSEEYLTENGKVYSYSANTYSERPCISGTGDPTALFYNLSWACLFAKSNQVNYHEDRRLVLLGPYSPDFRVYGNPQASLVDWQRAQFGYYATDGASVYFRHHKLTGADPRQFAPFFPFGDDEKWRRFFFSQSGPATYLAGNRLPDVDLAHLTILEPSQCPGQGLGCTWEYSLDCDHGYWGCRGLLARAGKDVVYLQYRGITVFQGMAKDDLMMFMTSKRVYFRSGGRFYEVVRDAIDRFATLADMDVATYAAEP